MTYEEVVEKISNIRRFGNLTGVELMGRILTALDHPQTGMRVIHIAGTNGKGSVSAFLCEILREAGCNVGMFTSPHLVAFRWQTPWGADDVRSMPCNGAALF